MYIGESLIMVLIVNVLLGAIREMLNLVDSFVAQVALLAQAVHTGQHASCSSNPEHGVCQKPPCSPAATQLCHQQKQRAAAPRPAASLGCAPELGQG